MLDQFLDVADALQLHLLAEVLVVGAEEGQIAAIVVRALGRLRARDDGKYAELALPTPRAWFYGAGSTPCAFRVIRTT